jgi:hypothetical protein
MLSLAVWGWGSQMWNGWGLGGFAPLALKFFLASLEARLWLASSLSESINHFSKGSFGENGCDGGG